MTNHPKEDRRFTGTWSVIDSPDFDDEYLRMETEPYATLRQTGDRVRGGYLSGRQFGDIDGRVQLVVDRERLKDSSVARNYGLDKNDSRK